MPLRLELVPPAPGGPRLVELIGALRIGAAAPRPFQERCAVGAGTGSVAVGALQDRVDDLRADVDLHGSVQVDEALVVTVTVQLRHVGAADSARALDAETTVVTAGSAVPFSLVCLDAHGCRAEVRGTIANRAARWR